MAVKRISPEEARDLVGRRRLPFEDLTDLVVAPAPQPLVTIERAGGTVTAEYVLATWFWHTDGATVATTEYRNAAPVPTATRVFMSAEWWRKAAQARV